MHFDEGLSARFKGESTKLVPKGVRGKSASEKLTEEGLVKFSARISIQVMTYTTNHRQTLLGILHFSPIFAEQFEKDCDVGEDTFELLLLT